MRKEAPSGTPIGTSPSKGRATSKINFVIKGVPFTLILSSFPVMKMRNEEIFSGSDLDNYLWIEEMSQGELPGFVADKIAEETGTTADEVARAFAEAVETEKIIGKKTGEPTADASLYVPGPIRIVESLTQKYRFRTIPEIGNDKEKIFYFNSQIYERAEELIKREAHAEYVRQWAEQLELSITADDRNHAARMKSLLDRGPSANDINEVLQMIRRTTFTHDEMNPDTYIPFKNGLLNLKTRRLDSFTPDLFYTYQVDANLLDRYVTLKDTPLFGSLLNTMFYEPDIPMALSYASYALRPDFPIHKTLFILGRERIGKGTFTRVIQGLMKKGSGAISLARLLTGERFQFSGVEGKNLLVDSETKRKFRRGTVLEWGVFCNLFGNDILSIEPKGKEAHDYVSKAKGIFLGNLPFIPVDSPPAISRILVIETRNERPKRVIPNLDEKILANERDLIATLLMQIMFKLEDREFMFPGQLTDDATAGILEELADPVANFVEEMTEFEEGINTNVKDAVAAFTEWCESKGIPPLKPQVFKKGFGRHYEKRLLGSRNEREYFFVNCKIFDTETEVQVQSQFQVEHGDNTQKTLKISLSGDRYRRVQHEYTNLRVREEDQIHDHDVRVSALKLNTGEDNIREPKITALDDNEAVFNLNREFPKKDTTQPSIINGKPRDSDVQSEIPSITEEDGKLVVSQLSDLGYIIDSNSKPDSSRKYFKIGIQGIPSLPPDKREKLEHIMQQEHFELFNTGVFGIQWFTRPLVDALKEGKP